MTTDMYSLSQRFHQTIGSLNSDFSYERRVYSKNQVPDIYDIVVAIPLARKCALWFTFSGRDYVCILLDKRSRDNMYDIRGIVSIESSDYEIYFGTIVYGCYYEHRVQGNTTMPYFVFEDMPLYKGQTTRAEWYRHRLTMFRESVDSISHTYLPLKLPVMWNRTSVRDGPEMPPPCNIFYRVHHYQYRALAASVPAMMIPPGSMAVEDAPSSAQLQRQPQPQTAEHVYKAYLEKPYYREMNQTHRTGVFFVTAALQNDVYYIENPKTNTKGQYEVAFVPDFNTSKMLNALFRNIKENKNLDAMEESDEEDEFQDTRVDRFVNLGKRIKMECIWNAKFRKWVPLRAIE